MTETAAADWREATTAFLAEHRLARAEVLADRLVATIEHDHHAYRRAAVVSHDDLVHSCRTNVRSVLGLLVEGIGSGGLVAEDTSYDAARATGSLRAEQGLPLDDVLRSFRIGGRLIWDDLVAEGQDRLDGAGLREVGSLLWEVVDATSAAMAMAYHDHERARVRSDEQQRATLWEGILSGGARDPGFALEAAELLDLPAAGELVVVVAEGLEATAAEQALVPHAAAFTRRGDVVVGLVALREDEPTAVYRALGQLTGGHEGPVVAASGVVSGLAAADEGHRQAQLALRAAGARSRLVAYDDVLPQVLLLTTPDVADRLLDRWVGPLAALGEEGELLLDTLRAWVSAGGSAGRAAALVPCHRNTVLNRLRRVGQLTGVELADDTVPTDLDLALRARELRR